jgi:sulfatase maturation enzyme AslB (radical SAM superfamily)
MSIKTILKKIDRNILDNRISHFYRKHIRADKLTGISLDISGNCNLNCEMCSFKKWYGDKNTMSLETFSKLKGIFYKLLGVELQCNAEPLLNPYIEKILQDIRRENENISISLVTNGTLLNKTTASILLREKINKILISVDAPNKELFEEIRKGAKFESVINNIRNLVSLRKNNENSNCEIGIIAVSTRHNFSQLIGVLELAKTLEVDSLTINGLEAYDEKMHQLLLYGSKIDPDVEDIFTELKKKAARYKIKLSLPSLKIIPYNDCVLNSCLVHWNGDISPCSLLSYKRP